MNKPILRSVLRPLGLTTPHLGYTNESQSSELVKYGQIYTQLIQNQLGNINEVNGQKCEFQISLNSHGKVMSLSSSGHEKLCQAGEAAVKRVDVFPLPKSDVATQLQQITLTLNFM